MPSIDRSLGRNVHFYDARDRDVVIGGLILTNGVTNANFYSMVNIIISPENINFELRNEDNITVEKDNEPLTSGKYYIDAADPICATNEQCLVRTISLGTGNRVREFCATVRSRDQRCIVTGEVALNADLNDWAGFEAAHIFPLAYESYWIDHRFSRWISVHPRTGGSINSVQNGILLRSDIHCLFDSYNFSINPDDNYKLVFFARDGKGLAGRHLDQEFIDHPLRPVDQLLRWHFRQAVLANMRGGGEPRFEHDFPPGSDIVGEILAGPKAAERMQFELFSRFAIQTEV